MRQPKAVAPGRRMRRTASTLPVVDRSRTTRAGLGATPTLPGEIAAAGSLVGAATSLGVSTGLLAAGSAIPIAGAVIAAVAGIAAALGLGQGCGSSCIEAAQQEQVFEAAADNLNRVAKAGMMPGTAAAQLIQALIPLAQQAEAQQGTKQAKAGASNAATVLQNVAQQAASLGSGISRPLDLKAAQSLFIPLNTSGWYPQALATAQQLALQILQTYAASAPSTTPASASSPAPVAGATGGTFAAAGPQLVATTPAMIPTTTTSTIGGLSTTDLLLLAAAVIAAVTVF